MSEHLSCWNEVRESSTTALERLGLEVVAYTLLGARSQAAMLMALIDADGQWVGWAQLGASKAWRMYADTENSRNVVKTRISLLRTSMDDIGLGGLIETRPVQRDTDGLAYRLNGRGAVLARLMEEVD